MIRFGITLAVFAIALATVGIASFAAPICSIWPVMDRAAMAVHFYDGRMRIFWITSREDRIAVTHGAERGPEIRVHKRPPGIAGAGPFDAGDAVQDLYSIRIGGRRAIGAFGIQWKHSRTAPRLPAGGLEVSLVRLPVWLPVAIMLLQPIRAVLFGPWLWRRRERRNLCLTCGYERTGLPEPRCPECGTPHARTCRRCGHDLAGNGSCTCLGCGAVSPS